MRIRATKVSRSSMASMPYKAFSLVELLVVLGFVGALAMVLLPAVQRSRDAASRTACRNHLRNQALALVATHDARGHFPAGDDAQHRRHHSWCSRILPYLEQAQLARRIQFQHPWLDPSGNAAAARTVVDVFRCPASELDFAGDTDYAGVRGSLLAPGTRWSDGQRSGVLIRSDRRHPDPVRVKDIHDGASRTLVIVESADREKAEHGMWADGLGIVLQSNGHVNEMKGEIASPHPGGANVAYADTRVGFLSDATDTRILSSLCTKAGGERMDEVGTLD